MDKFKAIAIEIKDEDTAEIARAVFPELGNIPLASIKSHFLVFGRSSGKNRPHALVPPTAVNDYYDHIENVRSITLKAMVERIEEE